MVRPDFAQWEQAPDDIYQLSLHAGHARSRERFQALYAIGVHGVSATAWAQEHGRRAQTVMGWVHRYNAKGPEGVLYRRTGGRTPLLRSRSKTPLPRSC
jgi:transposase